jgi:hypothetical protein
MTQVDSRQHTGTGNTDNQMGDSPLPQQLFPIHLIDSIVRIPEMKKTRMKIA